MCIAGYFVECYISWQGVKVHMIVGQLAQHQTTTCI